MPVSFTTFTLATFTPNISSTAALISGLLEPRSTRNEYVFAFCIASDVFSVMCGAVSRLISFSGLATFGASLMSTTFLPLVLFDLAAFGAVSAFSVFTALSVTDLDVPDLAFSDLAFSDLAALIAGAPR